MDLIVGYIDPGTGATLTQLFLAGSVGVLAVVKLKWHSIKAFFSRSNDHEEVEANDDAAVPAEDEDLVS